MEQPSASPLFGTSEGTVDEKSQETARLLQEIGEYVTARGAQLTAYAVNEHPMRQELIDAVATAHELLLNYRPSERPQDGQQPLHQQIGTRLLTLAPGTPGATVKSFKAGNVVLDAERFDLKNLPLKEYRLPATDIFDDISNAGSTDIFPIYPALAGRYLKTIVSDRSQAKRRLIDALTDTQVVELVCYCCAINRYRREPHTKAVSIDQQAKRLLFHLSGMPYKDILMIEGSLAKTTTQLIRSSKSMVRHLQAYSDFVLHQAQEMLVDPGYSLFEYDAKRGLVLAPESIDAIETILPPTEKHTPFRIVQFAMQRYAANTLLDRIQTEGDNPNMHDVTNNLSVIWLKINGKLPEEIEELAGIPPVEQATAFLALHRTAQPQLPMSRPFWRRVRSIMQRAKTVYVQDESDETDITYSPDQIQIDAIKPAGSMPSIGKITEARALEMSDGLFKARISELDTTEKMLNFIRLALKQPSAWAKQMLCYDDPESIVTTQGKTMSKELLARCISCPVREICLGYALSNAGESTHDAAAYGYNYAGYTPKERRELLETVDIQPQLVHSLLKAQPARESATQ